MQNSVLDLGGVRHRRLARRDEGAEKQVGGLGVGHPEQREALAELHEREPAVAGLVARLLF